VLEWRKGIDRRRWRQPDQTHLPYISRIRLSVKSPIFKRISPSPYLSIKPSTLMTQCDFFIYPYAGDLSHNRYQSFSRRDHMRSHGASPLFISYLHDAPSLISLSIHSYHIVRSSPFHDSPIVTCLLDDLVR